ncbi:MAG: hypothetical protein ICV78_20425 [Tolypothrix sp. Co-bin9]|nr:hypothetical protein [Tolypothrix sp. Co-bin9]
MAEGNFVKVVVNQGNLVLNYTQGQVAMVGEEYVNELLASKAVVLVEPPPEPQGEVEEILT